MANTSFADTDITYSDGQTNKLKPPDEIYTNGFKPPVRNSDGSVMKGDPLAANHLNYILNDLYAQITALEVRIAALETPP